MSDSDDAGPTTTHAEWGAGHPRLVFNVGEDWDGSPAREFPLVKPETTVGSSDTSDLQLTGLEPEHARIVHEDDDEYVLYHLGVAELGSEPDTAHATSPRHVLRTGAKVQVGPWSMFFSRDERADHGRPFGGRV